MGETRKSETREGVQGSGGITTAGELEARLCLLWGCATARELPSHAVQLVACAWGIETAKREHARLLSDRWGLLARETSDGSALPQ